MAELQVLPLAALPLMAFRVACIKYVCVPAKVTCGTWRPPIFCEVPPRRGTRFTHLLTRLVRVIPCPFIRCLLQPSAAMLAGVLIPRCRTLVMTAAPGSRCQPSTTSGTPSRAGGSSPTPMRRMWRVQRAESTGAGLKGADFAQCAVQGGGVVAGSGVLLGCLELFHPSPPERCGAVFAGVLLSLHCVACFVSATYTCCVYARGLPSEVLVSE